MTQDDGLARAADFCDVQTFTDEGGGVHVLHDVATAERTEPGTVRRAEELRQVVENGDTASIVLWMVSMEQLVETLHMRLNGEGAEPDIEEMRRRLDRLSYWSNR